jgi:hypothetical protein
MSDIERPLQEKKKRHKKPRPEKSLLDPAVVRDDDDPGDSTQRNFRYQHAYGVILLAAAKRGEQPYIAIWGEHHEDLLAERNDERYDAYQIKTSRPELGTWKLNDGDLVKAIGRFVDLVAQFGNRIANLYFVSNTEYDMVTPQNKDDVKRRRCPRLFLEHVKQCNHSSEIAQPYLATFLELQADCGCNSDELYVTLCRVNLILGPSRGDYDAVLSNQHLGVIEECRNLGTEKLNEFRDQYDQSSLSSMLFACY